MSEVPEAGEGWGVLSDLSPVPGPAESDSVECQKSRQLERDGVQAAEDGKHEEALRLFTEAITTAPQRASPYNNRAQLYRLMHRNDGT